MVAIVDYGVGNLFSLQSSLKAVGAQVLVTGEPEDLEKADRIILPGVGAFADAAQKLMESGLGDVVKQQAQKGKPVMGICLGMQLLFEKSYEYGEHQGLGLIPGAICPIADVIPQDLKIPHIGWNSLSFSQPRHPLMGNLPEEAYVYFVHSFYAKTDRENIIAMTEYGAPLTAAVARGNVCGCQFHPEKSGSVGLQILKNFCELEGEIC